MDTNYIAGPDGLRKTIARSMLRLISTGAYVARARAVLEITKTDRGSVFDCPESQKSIHRTDESRFHSVGIAGLEKQNRALVALANELDCQVRLRTRELQKRDAEILRQSEQLRELSSRLQQNQDDERRHIARELHDSAGQRLAALGMNLAIIASHKMQDPTLENAVQDSQELVQELSKEIRTMSYLLHPPLLDENGLPEAIRWYTRGIMARNGLDIELVIGENFGRLPREIELAVFRIVQECLTNIHRHSGSKTAAILVSRTGESVFLEVQDAGQGISVETLAGIQVQRAGVGITGMRERARHLGGVMNIQSDTSGTKVSVTFPVPITDTDQTSVPKSLS
jgi:signal transduction histidine kinase